MKLIRITAPTLFALALTAVANADDTRTAKQAIVPEGIRVTAYAPQP